MTIVEASWRRSSAARRLARRRAGVAVGSAAAPRRRCRRRSAVLVAAPSPARRRTPLAGAISASTCADRDGVALGDVDLRDACPSPGAGTSASTLSVEISTIVSSASIASPSCLCHSRIVPSVTDSPIAGIDDLDRRVDRHAVDSSARPRRATLRGCCGQPAARRAAAPRTNSRCRRTARRRRDGHRDGQPQRDDPQPRGREAGERHDDPAEAVGHAEDELAAACRPATSQTISSASVDRRSGRTTPHFSRVEGERRGARSRQQRAMRRSASSASAGQRVDVGRPPGVVVVLVVGAPTSAPGGEPGLADEHHQPVRQADERLDRCTRSGATDHSSSSSRTSVSRRALAEVDGAAGAERPAPGPRGQPRRAAAREPAPVGRRA